MNLILIKRRLGWYGLAWMGAFALVLLVALAGHFLAHADVIDMADLLIPIGLGVTALALAGVVVRDLFSIQTIGTRLAILLLAILLALPLLWSPVSATVAAAWVADRSIEYSSAYAQFRITISELIYPISQFLFGPALSSAWLFFQGLASVVGVLSALRQIFLGWRALTKGGGEPAVAEHA